MRIRKPHSWLTSKMKMNYWSWKQPLENYLAREREITRLIKN